MHWFMVTGATRTQSHTTSQGENVTEAGKFVGRTQIKCSECGHMQIDYSTWCEGRRRLFVLFLARFSRCSARPPQSETGGTEVFSKLLAKDTLRGRKTARTQIIARIRGHSVSLQGNGTRFALRPWISGLERLIEHGGDRGTRDEV